VGVKVRGARKGGSGQTECIGDQKGGGGLVAPESSGDERAETRREQERKTRAKKEVEGEKGTDILILSRGGEVMWRTKREPAIGKRDIRESSEYRVRGVSVKAKEGTCPPR